MLNLSLWDHWSPLDVICSSMNSTRKWQNDRHRCHGSHSGVGGGTSLRGMVKSDGGIQSVLAVFLPSAQTFINITSQPGEKPTSNLDRKSGRADQIKNHEHFHWPICLTSKENNIGKPAEDY